MNERKATKVKTTNRHCWNEDDEPMPFISVICVKSNKSLGGVVASVREMAGGLYAVVFDDATNDPNQGMTILFQSSSRNNVWKVRQGAFMALKYSAV
jgi:hypothetical protein